MRHLTVRVAWHDNRWNGAVCDAPSRNGYCLTLKRIHEARDDAREDELAGRAWGTLMREDLPPCMAESAGFMNAQEWTRTFEHIYQQLPKTKATHGDLRATRVNVAPYTTFAVPFAWMLAENQRRIDEGLPMPLPADEPAPFSTEWVFGRARQEALSKQFFGQLAPDHSLVFFYCKEGQPLGDHISRLVVGVGRILSIGPLRYYDSHSEKSYPFWDREIHHSIRLDGFDGFLLPYHEYLAPTGDADEDARRRALLEEIAVAVDPAHIRTFSYAAELATPDVALSTLIRCLDAARLVREHGIAKGPWERREEWLNDQIAVAWRDRGAFPGLGSALQAFGLRMGTALALDLAQSGQVGLDENPWPIVDAILRGEKRPPRATYESHLKPLRPVWNSLPAERRALLQLLARFDLSPEQASRWYDPLRRAKATSSSITDSDILANPYRMAEADLGDTDIPAVSVEVIDRGIFPLDSIKTQFPLLEASPIEDQNDQRRIRSALVDVLRKAANDGDTLLGCDEALVRLERLSLARPCAVGVDWLMAYREQLAEAISLFEVPLGASAEHGASVMQLSEIRAREERVRKILAARTAAPLPSLGTDWRSLLIEAIGKDYDASNERHHEALKEQAAAIERITTRKLSVLTGRAGTGKTSVMGALLRCASLRDNGVLLLAPTGKARVKLAKAAGKDARALTIAQFLYALKRYDGTRQRPLFQGEQYKRERTVVIDECSMLTLDDLAAVLAALDLAHVQRLFLVGDPNQLPPIGAGRPFADLVAYLDAQADKGSGASADALGRLTIEVRTQTEGGTGVSDALRLAAWFTREPQPVDADGVLGEVIEGTAFNDLDICFWKTPEELREQILKKMQQYLGLSHPADIIGFDRVLGIDENGLVSFEHPDRVEQFQILSPTRVQPHGVYDLNRWLQRQFRAKELHGAHQGYSARLGQEEIVRKDKVIQVQNEQRDMYSRENKSQLKGYLANGEIGVVVSAKKPHLNVLFAGHPMETAGYWASNYSERGCPLELAYALTVHKAQGSEFGVVFVVIPEKGKRPLLSRELLYTALTRARQQLVLLVQGETAAQLYDFSLPSASETARRNTNLFAAAIREPDAEHPFAEHLIHQTRHGQLVRSKSELVIANMLEDMGILYEYEKVLKGEVVPGWKYPDFTFVDPVGEIVVWEHLGMLNQPVYAQGWEKKRAWYEKNGFTEGHNLFTTRDDEQGGLDSRKVEQVAKSVEALL